MNYKELGRTSPLIISGINQHLNSTPSMGYSILVAAQSAAGFDGPIRQRRTGAPTLIAGAFFTPAIMFYGSCAREAFWPAGSFLCPRSVNLRTAATLNRLTAIRGSSLKDIGAKPMKHTHAQNPSITNRVAALKSRAISALHANSSLKVRLDRYNSAMQKARALESKGGVQ